MARLTTAQLVALRELLDGNPPSTIHGRTRGSLTRFGYVNAAGLTPSGRKVIEDHLRRSGDGPEHLKAMFRF